MSNPSPARRRRRWWQALGVVLVLVVAGLAVLPWLIASGPLRSRVDSALNRAFSPGSIRFEGLHLSWFGPTRLDRVVVLDPQGKAVIQVPSAVLGRTLGQLILKDRGPARLDLDGASFEVTRSDEGTVDLVEALRTIIASPDPDRDLTIRVEHGSIRYRDPFLAEPLASDEVDLTIRVPYAPSPVTWSAKFAQGEATLECQGDFDVWLSKGGPPRTPELTIGVVGKRWPFVARTAGLDAVGRLNGALDFIRKRGRWVFSGDARFDGLNAQGKSLAGDRLAFDQAEAGWDIAQGEEGWKIRRLSATTPFGQLKVEGQLEGPGGLGKQRIEGVGDLAEIARQLPHALRLRDGLTVDRGTARVAVDITSAPGQTSYEIEAKVADLAARDHDRPILLKDPATLNARIVRAGDDSRVERLSVRTAFLDASAEGKLVEGVAYRATVDLGGLRKQLGDWVDLGTFDMAGSAELSGRYAIQVENSSEGRTSAYRNDARGKISELRVDGVGPWAVRRDLTTFDLKAEGPALASGVPEGLDRLGLSFQSGKSRGVIDLQSGAGTPQLMASLVTPWKVGDQTRKATIELAGVRSSNGTTLDLDRVLVSLGPSGRNAAEPRMALIASGKLNLADGELSLNPLPGLRSESVILEPEGLRVSGLGRGLESLRIDGGLSGDLVGLDILIADATRRKPLGLSGRWSAVASARGDAAGLAVSGKFGLDEPAGTNPRPNRPTGLALRAHYSPKDDRLDLSEFTVSTPYGTLDVSGKLEEATGEAVVDLRGHLAPDFAAINALLVARVEPGAHLEGRPRAFRASGPIGGGGSKGWQGLDAEVGFDLSGADVYGMKFGPSPVVLRANRGRLLFDPIGTTLNDGHIRLEPEFDLDAPGGPVLRLARNSGIREARINDEVSRRVLAYVAPILDQATRANGLVSVDLDHAEFPISPGRGRQVKVEGAVSFKAVEFAPGPLATEILGAIGRRDLSLKLDQPVTLTIADGRVNQHGMTIPIGGLTRIELDGWVDFDRNLALNATLPVTPAMLGNNPLLSDIVAGARVRLPISGTLDSPSIDREAFASNIQELGKSLLTRGATRGAMEILKRLAGPRDPAASPPPPRPSPVERKANRQEKKAIRRGEIPPPPTEGPRS